MICKNYITLYTSFDRFDGPRKNCKTATSHLIDIRPISAEWKKSIWLCEIILASVVNGLTIKTVVDWNWNTTTEYRQQLCQKVQQIIYCLQTQSITIYKHEFAVN